MCITAYWKAKRLYNHKNPEYLLAIKLKATCIPLSFLIIKYVKLGVEFCKGSLYTCRGRKNMEAREHFLFNISVVLILT